MTTATKNEEGYYDVVLGSLGRYTSLPLNLTEDSIIDLFEADGGAISKKEFIGELGSPLRFSDETIGGFQTRRGIEVDVSRAAVIIKDVKLSDKGIITGKVKATGREQEMVDNLLKAKKPVYDFSIRGEASSIGEFGKRAMTSILTWDFLIKR